MQTITLKANISLEKEVEITVPFFARRNDEREYIGLLDEATVVRIYVGTSHTSVSNSQMDSMEKSKLIEAFETWHSCTEEDFLAKYEQVIESISKITA